MAEQFSGKVEIKDANDNVTIELDGDTGKIIGKRPGSPPGFSVSGNDGALQIRDSSNRAVFTFINNTATLYIGSKGNEGNIIVRDNSGNQTIHLNGDKGDIILENADAAEQFEVVDAGSIKPGMIMTIDKNGKLKPSSTQYDRKVVGVVAGAGKYRPGIVFDKKNNNANQAPISVLGKASCMADATYAPIEVGDMLTTSQTTGHAMKATDNSKAFGSILGKALTPLSSGVGFVDILVTLQ